MIRTSIILIFIIALCCSSLLCSRAFGESTWTFVMMGDTRGEDDTDTGVSQYLKAIADKVASLNPNLVVVNGDLINGDALNNSPDVNNPRIPYATQFTKWKEAMNAVYAAGILIYPVRGNHENYADDVSPTIAGLKEAYYSAFGSTVPQNGPNNGPGDNQVGYSWDLKVKNVRIVAVDQYFYYQPTPLGGRNYYQIDQSWLNAQLSKTAPRRYTFVMAHEPVYSLSHAEGAFYGTSAQGIADRKAFWDSLGANGVKMYLTSHVHDVQVGTAVDGSGNIIYQNMEGNGGAKLDPDDKGQDPLLTHIYSNFEDYGFSLYTVTDNTITVDYYLYDPTTPIPTWSFVLDAVTLFANPVYTWNTASVNFSDAASWDPATVPGALDTAVFDSGPSSTSTVNFTSDAHNKRLFVASGPVTFDLAGKTYTADSTAIDGSEYASYRPSLTISGVAGSHFNTNSLTMDGVSSFIVNAGASATCGTITIEGGSATIGGSITVTTLDLGANTLTVIGPYAQPAGTTLKLTANSATDFGKITSNAAAIVDAASAVNITVGSYIPNNATLKIIDTGALGIGNSPGTITSSDQYVTFSGASSGGNLVLTVDRTATGFGHAATNSNAAAVGAVLDNITNPSADMTTVLNTLEGLSPGQVASSLNTMSPTADGALLQSAMSITNQFNGALTSHLENTRPGITGISTGPDRPIDPNIWAQGLGDYAHQDPRGLSNGYNAASWGIAGGADFTYRNDSLHMGIASGYGQTFVRSKDFSGRTDIDSIPGIIYFNYENANCPFYLDSALVFIYNTYTGSRHVTVGTAIERTADADYRGQQYSGYFEGGYSFFYNNLCMTPLASVNYMHLHTAGYTESGAGALDLNVDSQDYDMCMTGIGVKLAYPAELKCVSIIPDLHAKWLYDWIGESQATTASFIGGGTSFGTIGYRPARSGYDLGTKISIKTKYNISLDLGYDFLLKEDYYEHYGTLTVRYSF